MHTETESSRLGGLLVFACLAIAGPLKADDDASRVYDVSYEVSLRPDDGQARVELTIEQSRDLLREMRFDSDGVSNLDGDGQWSIRDGEVTWLPPVGGGELSWTIDVRHERDNDGYDAWLDDDWGLFRAEDLIPRAATRTLKGAVSDTRFRVRPPPGWSVVTEYPNNDDGSEVSREGRRFSQPSGWIVTGDLGVRRDRIAGVRVVVAAPEGQGARRLDMLALLNWTLPELTQVLPGTMERLTIVSAGVPMWRGALSAPRSLYLHSDRPMISENGTSSLLHEVMHVAIGLPSRRGYDWIVEGLAEFYALALLGRSGTLTDRRYERALDDLEDWGESADTLCRRTSTGATTARAVTVFAALDSEIRTTTDNRDSLDDVLRTLVEDGRAVDLERLRKAVDTVMGASAKALRPDRLPGCP